MTGGDTDDEHSQDHGADPTGGRSEAVRSPSGDADAGRADPPDSISESVPSGDHDHTDTAPDVLAPGGSETERVPDRVTIVGAGEPSPHDDSAAVPVAGTEAAIRLDPDEPRLPGHSADAPSPPPVTDQSPMPPAGTVPSASAYRNPNDRNRSVYRRANPWYRRLARGVIALCLISALGLGIYVGARAIQDYTNRDQLPPPGPDVPTIRETTILVASTSSALQLQGTLSFDTVSGAYEFVGLAGSPNAQDRLTSPDGDQIYVLNPNATWTVATGDEAIVGTVEQAISVLSGTTTADAILTNRIRRGYVDLVDESEEGPESDELTRYDVALDLTGFADSFPLQWSAFQTDAIPGVTESRRHDTSFWLDDESILVRVQDTDTGWNWERLTYSDDEYLPFRPPPTQVIDPDTQAAATGIDCRIDRLDVGWTTTLSTCEESQSVGRELATSVGLADSADGPAAELAFASVCTTLQGGEPREFDDPAYLELAGRLVDAGVCPGDTALVQLSTES